MPIGGTISLTTVFSGLGILSGNTQSNTQYDFYYGVIWDDATTTYNQYDFYKKTSQGSRYDWMKQWGSEKSYYENIDDSRIEDFSTYYDYAGEYLAGSDPEVAPTAAFSANATQSTANTILTFTNATTGTAPLTYTWDFGDGGTSTSTSPTHSFSATGSYTISLTASNAFGIDGEIKTNYITIGDLVVASFSSSTQSTAPDTVITFTDTSTGNPDTFAWDFGDTNTSTSQNPTHSYSATGSYTVSMTASSVYDTDSTSDGIEIVAGAPIEGGTETTDGGDIIHTFTTADTLVVNEETTVKMLVVGAGSGGSRKNAGGGGGGGGGWVYYDATYVLPVGSYAVTIGAGGIGPAADNTRGSDGGSTVVTGLITATGAAPLYGDWKDGADF